MAYAKFDGYEIPLIYALSVGRRLVGDRSRTAGGLMRQDSIEVKRAWEIRTRPMTRTAAETLLGYLDSGLYASGDFWLQEFGSESSTVEAYIEAESVTEEVIAFREHNGTFHNDGRQLTMTVLEV